MSDMNGGQPPDEGLVQALAAGGPGSPGAMPDDHDPLAAGHGFAPEPVEPDDVEQECMRAILQAARLAAGATDARQVSDAGTGAVAFLTVVEKLNADEQPPPPEQVPVMPHAVGMVRQALAADHGVDPAAFDQMLLGAHQHLSDLEQAGTPTLGEAPAPSGADAAPPSADELQPPQGAPSGP